MIDYTQTSKNNTFLVDDFNDFKHMKDKTANAVTVEFLDESGLSFEEYDEDMYGVERCYNGRIKNYDKTKTPSVFTKSQFD